MQTIIAFFRRLFGVQEVNKRNRLYGVSLNNYKDPRVGLAWTGADVSRFTELFKRKSQFWLVRWIADKSATAQAICSLLQEAVDAANRGDRVRYIHSGHGSFVKDAHGDEPDRKDEGLVAYDLDLVLDDTVHAILAQLKPDADFVMVVDTCFSGGMDRALAGAPLRSTEGISVRSIPAGFVKGVSAESRKVRAVRRGVKTGAGGSMAAACQETETSAESAAIQGGAFTTFLCAVLEKANGATTVAQAVADATARMHAAGFPQTPKVFGNGEIKILGKD